jgi:hypothetical protein
MEGSVKDIHETSAWIEVPELGGGVRAVIPQNTNLEVNQLVTVGIRPEYIQLTDQPGENTFLCTVDTLAQGVTATNYYFHVNGVGATRHYIMVILSSRNGSVICEGKSCHLFLPPEHVVVITH